MTKHGLTDISHAMRQHGTLYVWQGVFLTLKAMPSGQNGLTRIRFARGLFSKAQAEAWWGAHKAEVAERCNLAPASPRTAAESTESPLEHTRR